MLAKPAEETPLIAAEAVRLLHQAGVPADVLQLLPGAGEVGAALVADAARQGVDVHRLDRGRAADPAPARRAAVADGQPVPLIAETGGQNAMVVDSSALAEQVVADVIASAFDSAGQRCSALRVLCLQEDIADRTLAMLKGAMRELAVGNPDRLSTDVGPVITAEARDGILSHIEAMRARGQEVRRSCRCRRDRGTAPSCRRRMIEIGALAEVKREVFGPVLHVLRYRRERARPADRRRSTPPATA